MSTTRSLVTLPPELLDAVCEPLAESSASLAALARTCSILAPSATRVLYRSLAVNPYKRTLSSVLTLAAHPELAQLVHSFSIILDDSHELSVFPAFYVQLRTALAYMHNLSHLDVLIDATLSWVLAPSDPFPYPIYDRLEHFACAFGYDTNTSAFLVRTPALRALQIAPSPLPEDTAIPPSVIPHLTSFTGPAALVPLLAPRPLMTLHLAGDLSPEEVLEHAESHPSDLSDVRVLSVITSSPPAELVAALARAYPGLFCLRVMATSAFWDAPDPDMTCYSRIAYSLASLPHLVAFELSGMHWEARPKTKRVAPLSGADEETSEKEWVSPPVSPRGIPAAPGLEVEGRESELADEFAAWGYY